MTRSRLLNEKELASEYGFSLKKLQKARCTGDGPVYIKFGRSVLYDVRDVEAFLAENKYRSTSQTLQVPV